MVPVIPMSHPNYSSFIRARRTSRRFIGTLRFPGLSSAPLRTASTYSKLFQSDWPTRHPLVVIAMYSYIRHTILLFEWMRETTFVVATIPEAMCILVSVEELL